MQTAIIYFSDQSTVTVSEGNLITPIISNKFDDDATTASMGETVELWNHVHNGLIPSLMDAFTRCDFFYLNHNYNIAYNSNSIVKIELV